MRRDYVKTLTGEKRAAYLAKQAARTRQRNRCRRLGLGGTCPEGRDENWVPQGTVRPEVGTPRQTGPGTALEQVRGAAKREEDARQPWLSTTDRVLLNLPPLPGRVLRQRLVAKRLAERAA